MSSTQNVANLWRKLVLSAASMNVKPVLQVALFQSWYCVLLGSSIIVRSFRYHDEFATQRAIHDTTSSARTFVECAIACRLTGGFGFQYNRALSGVCVVWRFTLIGECASVYTGSTREVNAIFLTDNYWQQGKKRLIWSNFSLTCALQPIAKMM